MTLAPQDRKALSEVRMSRAYEFLEDARANFKDGRHKTSVNRSYYAVLNAARALLILEGINPETHDCCGRGQVKAQKTDLPFVKVSKKS